jgi:hypothetical protein
MHCGFEVFTVVKVHGPLKCWYPTTTLHGVTTQKTSTRRLHAGKAEKAVKNKNMKTE